MKFSSGCSRLLLLLSPAIAATSVTIPHATAQDLVLEEVVVTARKREESLQETPVAVSAFTGNDLAESGLSNLSDLSKIAPNIDVQNGNGASGVGNIFIRGIGARNTGVNFDSGVGVYLDGVYMGRPDGTLLDNIDIASVQVLRGPQGTLFGKNTTGGAILYTTNAPGDEVEGNFQARLGNMGRMDLQGTVNVPIVEDLLSSRFSVSARWLCGERLSGREAER